MSMSKQSHEQLWTSILTSNYNLYYKVNANLQCCCYDNNNNNNASSSSGGGDVTAAAGASEETVTTTTAVAATAITTNNESILQLIPVRIMVNDQPAIQRPVRQYINNNNDGVNNNSSTTTSQQPQQKRNSRPLWEIFETTSTTSLEKEASYYTTLGQYLSTCLPNYFTTITTNDTTTGKITTTTATLSSSNVYYSIQGIQPSLNCPLVELWQTLSHPDHFLYIIVVVH
jgi:hypothetical protein